MLSVFLHLSSPWPLEEDVASASPSHPVSIGPSPILLSAASAPFPAPAPSLFPSPVAAAPSRGDLVPSLGPGAAPADHGHVHAPLMQK